MRLKVLGQSMKLGAVVFMDFGRVWHPGIGGGLRITQRAAVVRMDYARSTESGRQRFYVTFGHMF